MAEFAAASGAAGLVSLGLEVTKGLVTYCQAWKGLPGDMATLVARLESLSGILGICHSVLEKDAAAQDTPTRNLVEVTLVACGARIRTLENVWKRYNPTQLKVDGTFKARLHRAGYAFRKDELTTLYQTLDRVQADLVTAMKIHLQ